MPTSARSGFMSHSTKDTLRFIYRAHKTDLMPLPQWSKHYAALLKPKEHTASSRRSSAGACYGNEILRLQPSPELHSLIPLCHHGLGWRMMVGSPLWICRLAVWGWEEKDITWIWADIKSPVSDGQSSMDLGIVARKFLKPSPYQGRRRIVYDDGSDGGETLKCVVIGKSKGDTSRVQMAYVLVLSEEDEGASVIVPEVAIRRPRRIFKRIGVGYLPINVISWGRP